MNKTLSRVNKMLRDVANMKQLASYAANKAEIDYLEAKLYRILCYFAEIEYPESLLQVHKCVLNSALNVLQVKLTALQGKKRNCKRFTHESLKR